jgi:RNA polymerase sigma-70 factor (ECF subfamily)
VETLQDWLADYYATAYRTARLILRNPADAEEAVQDAFLRAWRFRSSLPQGGDVRPWLYRVVVNACCSKLRKEQGWRQRVDADEDALADVADPGRTPSEAAEDAASCAAVLDALQRLPEHLRITVVLRYYSGLSEKEIATAISRRPGTVKSRLNDARTRLAADPRLRALVLDVAEEA